MIFRQLFDLDSCTYTYLIGSTGMKEAVLIDPVDGHLEDYLELLRRLGLSLKYSIETHVHADHITASGRLRQQHRCRDRGEPAVRGHGCGSSAHG